MVRARGFGVWGRAAHWGVQAQRYHPQHVGAETQRVAVALLERMRLAYTLSYEVLSH